MKVLIAGGRNVFCELLIDRFIREKHDVYTISHEKSGQKHKKCIHYNFELTDKKLSFILYNIMPDAIIFLGAFDGNYDFSSESKSSMDFLASLSNLLISASSLNIVNFVYLSTSMVYGTKRNMALTEQLEAKPEDIKSLVIAEGESLCLKFNELSSMKANILRFSDIYGTFSEKNHDFCYALFSESLQISLDPDPVFEPPMDQYMSPIYISDAVDAIYKTVTSDKPECNIYNVSSFDTSLSYIYSKVRDLTSFYLKEEARTDAIATPDEDNSDSALPICLTVDSTLFSECYGYKPLVDVNTGLTRMHQSTLDSFNTNEKKDIPKKEKKRMFPIITPFLENLIVFTALAALSIVAQSNTAFSNINFMFFYIIIIAMTFGLLQSSLSVILASGFFIWQALSTGTNAIDMLTGIETLIKVLELLIVGVICGQAKDHMRNTIYEKNQALKDLQQEMETIYNINETNIKIKQTLDERLVNYGDSLAKIYSIVDKLNSLQPDAIFFSAIDVIREIMNANDVSIYIVTGGSFKMCRLMAKTPSSTRIQKKSIPLADLGELRECLERNKIYVNKELAEDMPVMAAPIFSNRELVSIILLWSVDFENLTIDNTNRFLVLSQLISSAIERAYIHTQNMRESMHLPGTSVLTAEAFDNVLMVHKEAAKNNTSTYEAILISCINPETELALDFRDLAGKVQSMLRSTDYMGQCREDDNKLYLLLTNTNMEDSKFVYDRLSNADITATEVHL